MIYDGNAARWCECNVDLFSLLFARAYAFLSPRFKLVFFLYLFNIYNRIEFKVSPFVAIKDGAVTQFFGCVLQELSKSMNFTIKVMGTSEVYGNWNEENRTWTGVIGEVVSRVVDFGVGEFSLSNHRLNVVDFTIPLILSRNKVYFQKPDASSVQWSAYFKVFVLNGTILYFCIL